MTGLADIFPFNQPVTSPSFPATIYVGQPPNPTNGMIWYDPNTGVMQIYTTTGWETVVSGAQYLRDLLDVDVSGLLDGDILVYDAASGKWLAVAQDFDYGRY